jgi:2-phosphosulfolactate phosphatase
MASATVVIDCFPESVPAYRDDHAIVAIDVIRATTTATTAVALGLRCYVAGTLEELVPLAARLDNPLLVGEVGGNMPYGFDLTNSPAALTQLADRSRPMILLSTSGTRLVCESRGARGVYVACLRNYRAVARHLADVGDRVAVIGAGARGEFREEDQLCCGWIAELLLEAGFDAADEQTERVVTRWRGADLAKLRTGNSAKYLVDTGQLADLDFVLAHVDDLDVVVELQGDEIVQARVFA